MPANLTPQYREAENRYRDASTVEEKIACLREMLRIIPKHKGTEKLQADLKKRLSKLQKTEGGPSAPRRVPGQFVEREGPKQVVLVGAANAGKSALLGALTSAVPEVASYPYTTTVMQPGMMPFEDVKLQLVDGPALTREFSRPWMANQIRAADLLLWVMSLGDDDVLANVEETRAVLESFRVEMTTGGEADRAAGRLPALLVGTHADVPDAELRAALLTEAIGARFALHRVSATTGEGLDTLRETIFQALSLVRVYTKQPGKKPDLKSPFLLERGATVLGLAEAVHKEIAERLSFARIWGRGAFDGQHVQRDHVLSDGDIVELHA